MLKSSIEKTKRRRYTFRWTIAHGNILFHQATNLEYNFFDIWNQRFVFFVVTFQGHIGTEVSVDIQIIYSGIIILCSPVTAIWFKKSSTLNTQNIHFGISFQLNPVCLFVSLFFLSQERFFSSDQLARKCMQQKKKSGTILVSLQKRIAIPIRMWSVLIPSPNGSDNKKNSVTIHLG